MNIYVGNLARETSEDEVRSLFESHGKIDTVNLIKDRYTGDSRGFAFVEMPDKAEAQAAIVHGVGDFRPRRGFFGDRHHTG